MGKSTLVNRLLGEDRVVVYDEGTTRDSVYIDYERHGKNYTLMTPPDKRKNIAAIEKFSIVKTLQAIEDANVVVDGGCPRGAGRAGYAPDGFGYRCWSRPGGGNQ